MCTYRGYPFLKGEIVHNAINTKPSIIRWRLHLISNGRCGFAENIKHSVHYIIDTVLTIFCECMTTMSDFLGAFVLKDKQMIVKRWTCWNISHLIFIGSMRLIKHMRLSMNCTKLYMYTGYHVYWMSSGDDK